MARRARKGNKCKKARSEQHEGLVQKSKKGNKARSEQEQVVEAIRDRTELCVAEGASDKQLAGTRKVAESTSSRRVADVYVFILM